MEKKPTNIRQLNAKYRRDTIRSAKKACIIYLIICPAVGLIGMYYIHPSLHKYVIGIVTIAFLILVSQQLYYVTNIKRYLRRYE